MERATGTRARACFVGLAGLAATAFYASVVEPFYPVADWLFWTLLQLWGWVLVFNVACVCFGAMLLRRVLRVRELPVLETCVHSMVVGVVGFVLCMYAGGALALFGPVFALLLPALMIALGGFDGWQLARRVKRELARARPRGVLINSIAAFGVLCTGLIYLGLMTPDALNYDATWYHSVIPQEYARQGRLVAFPGNYNMGIPHLHGMIHTWGFCVPGLDMPRRWMLILHDEFGLFLWTLAGVLAGVRRLVDDQRLRGAWTAVFLFPSIAVYDFNMGGAGDHVAAFFAVPMLLALLELCATFSAGSAALFAVATAGCALSKYQAVYLVVPMSVVFVLSWLRRLRELRRERRAGATAVYASGLRDLVRAPLIVAGLAALLVSPHFIKNAVFYGNPLYPLAQELFKSSWPSAPNGPLLVRYIFTDDNWKPQGTLLEKALHALELVVNFSWKAHYSFTKNFPVFGSLFTLLLPLLIAVRRPGRTAIAAGIGLTALFVWGFTYNVDRNLQIILPLLATVTAALIVLGWQLGWIARVGLSAIVGFQLVWGGDAFFYSAYERIQSSMSLIRSGYEGNAKRRFDGYRSVYRSIGRALPRNARVLLHSSHLTLGIDREIIQDWNAFQGFISYETLRTPREVYDYLRARGITHILYLPGERTAPSKQEEVLFQAFVNQYGGRSLGNFGGYRLLEMPASPPPAEPPYRVASLGLGGYRNGIYPIEKLNTVEQLPARLQKYAKPERDFDAARDLGDVDALFVGASARVPEAAQAILHERFTQLIQYSGQFSLYVKKAR